MTRNYFCYSSALDTEALEIWKSQHGYTDFKLETGEVVALHGHKIVFNFASRFWGGRVAGLSPSEKPGDQVYGVLFAVDESFWPAVEHKEGVLTGACVPVEISVETRQGRVEATAFTTNPNRESLEGPLSAAFLETLRKAYKHWNFPIDAIEHQLTET